MKEDTTITIDRGTLGILAIAAFWIVIALFVWALCAWGVIVLLVPVILFVVIMILSLLVMASMAIFETVAGTYSYY